MPVVLYESETWSLQLSEEHILRVFENRILRKVSGPKTEEVTGNGEDCIIMSIMICAPYQTSLCTDQNRKDEMDGACS